MATKKASTPKPKSVKRPAPQPAPPKVKPKTVKVKVDGKKKTETNPARSNGKHPGGRPTKYVKGTVEKLPGMFTEGQSIVEVCVALGVSVSTYYSWEQEYPEFLEASTRGKLVSRAWWEKTGRENLFDESEYDADAKISTQKKFNDRLWSKNMGCRFKNSPEGLFNWTDKQEVEHAGNITVKIDPDDAEL